mgnify:CR=1 FL=1
MHEFSELGPAPNGMSAEYKAAMRRATRTMGMAEAKIDAGQGLTADEGRVLLNEYWDVYLLAVSEGDMQIAKETNELVNLITRYMELHGYTVQFIG